MYTYIDDLKQTYDQSISYIDYSKLNGKTILFTGARGLIGRYFVDYCMYLNKYYDYKIKIIAVARSVNDEFKEYNNNTYFELILKDVTTQFDIDENIDYIIHAASPANPYFYANYPVDVIKANVLGSLNMLELAKEKKAKMIFVSSGEVYGNQVHDGNGFKECQAGIVDSSMVRSCYTESKRCSETLCVSYASQFNVFAMVARLCFIYGPTYTKSDNRCVFQFLNNGLNKEDIVLKSKGEQIRSYLYVSDSITALLKLLLDGKQGEMYNVSYSKSVVSVKEIAETVAKYSNVKIKYEIPTENEASGYSKFMNAVQNSEKLVKIGWKPYVLFDEGIKRIIEIKK